MLRGERRLANDTGWVGVRRKERSDVGALLEALSALETPPDALDASALEAALPRGQFAGCLGPRTARVAAAEGDAVVKRVATARLARAAHENAHALRLAGVSTPRVLGFAAPRRGRGGAYVLTEHMRAPQLGALAGSGVLGDPGARRRITLALARALGALHDADWRHGALALDKILVFDDEVVLLGVEHARRGRTRRSRFRDLSTLALGLDPAYLGPVERGRFLAAYLGARPDPRGARAEWVRAWTRAGGLPARGEPV